MKNLWQILLLMGALIVIAFLIKVYTPIGKINFSKNTTAVINNHEFKIEVAKTDEQKVTGLSKYKTIDDNLMMVFPFKKADYYAFWMKSMKFPIDIIYVKDNKIVDIIKNAPAPKSASENIPIYKPKKVADTVLEINAGLSDKYKIEINQTVKLNY